MKYSFISLIVFLFWSCSQERDINNAVYKINLDSLDNNTYPQLVNRKYIFLETNEQSLIGNVNRLYYRNHQVYIFDDKSKQIFCFDDKGKFLYKIHSVGQGPGEYLYPVDMDVDNDGNIYVNDPVSKRIVKYENGFGNKSEIISIDKRCLDFFISSHYVYLCRVNDKKGFTSSLNSTDLRTKVNRIWSECHWDENNQIPYFSKHYIFRSGENSYYYERFRSQLYKIENDSVYEYINFKSSNIPTKSEIIEYSKSTSEGLMKPGVIRDVFACYETDDYLYVGFKSFPVLHVLIQKQSGYAWNISEIFKSKFGSSETVAVNGNELITLCFPNQSSVEKILTECDMSHEDNVRLKSLKDDDNPILIFYEFDK